MNKEFNKYLQKHPPFTDFDPAYIGKADIVVVIPVYLEDDLLSTLNSLVQCRVSEEKVAVLLVVNAQKNAESEVIEKQKNTIEEITQYISTTNHVIDFFVIEALDLPKKHFGAGLARKIGMDLAVKHFSTIKKSDGIIVSLDADTIVSDNYFTSIASYFKVKKHKGCSIYFEHPVKGDAFNEEIYNAIIQYELHLRYYVACLKMINFPYAFHTIGSCFAFKAEAYVKAGGMNRRQGGEEFYFIQKLIQMGGYGELNDTVIQPSPRISDRVPFGTGPTIKSIVESGDEEYLTYNLQGFIDLKILFENMDSFYQITEPEYQEALIKLPGRVRSYLLNSVFWEELNAVSQNCSELSVFRKRFYHVFNAFRVVKYVNYIHEHFLEKVSVFDAAIELLQLMDVEVDDIFDELELLKEYRRIQRNATHIF